MDLEKLNRLALECGFTKIAALDPSTIELREEVREMCARCSAHGKNWSCPPHCGELEDLRRRIGAYPSGILVQTVGEIEDSFDGEGMMEAEARHKASFKEMRRRLSEEYPGMLALCAGCCTICEACSCPDAPCRFPDLPISSMEAYGMVVLDVCRANGLPYYYGSQAIAYTSCFLFK